MKTTDYTKQVLEEQLKRVKLDLKYFQQQIKEDKENEAICIKRIQDLEDALKND